MASSTIIIAALLLVTIAQAQDPTCSTGVQAAGACCPSECGTCGGPNCGLRGRMLGVKCCISAIKNMDANCLTSDPPCKITTRDPDFVAISDTRDPRCVDGLRRSRACCPAECSVCGGRGCRARGALINSSCCPGEIRAGTRGCKDTGAPCALFRDSTTPMESPMPMETEMPMETQTPMETQMPMETPTMMETPMPTEVPMETEAPLPAVCSRMRSKFLGGCFCYLVVSGELRVRQARLYRPFCREMYGRRKEILSLVFTCRRFVNSSNAPERVMKLIDRINTLIPTCAKDIPLIVPRT